MSKDILLKEANRDELIEELLERESITSVKVQSGTGANIKTMSGNVAITGENYIFVIDPLRVFRGGSNE